MSNDLLTALGVSLLHTISMGLTGALLAVFVYFWLGLKFISKAWFNLDKIWASSLILVGAFGLYLTSTH
jgi:cation transport ATPase